MRAFFRKMLRIRTPVERVDSLLGIEPPPVIHSLIFSTPLLSDTYLPRDLPYPVTLCDLYTQRDVGRTRYTSHTNRITCKPCLKSAYKHNLIDRKTYTQLKKDLSCLPSMT